MPTRASLTLDVDSSLRRRSESLEVTTQVIPETVQAIAEPQASTRHRRHLSACGTIQQPNQTTEMESR